MNFKKLVLAGIAVAAMGTFTLSHAQAEKRQGGGRGGMTPEAQIERIETAVGKLSDEQKKKITAIYAKSAEKMREIGRDGGREKMMEVMQETRKEVRAALTPEQQKKFDDMPQGRGGPGGGGRKKEN
jgi:Spy/CpxP family protein refolding chaperone